MNLVIHGNYVSFTVDDDMGVSHFLTVHLEQSSATMMVSKSSGSMKLYVQASIKPADIIIRNSQKKSSSDIPNYSNMKVQERQPHLH